MAIFYVATTGNDGSSGSQAYPWLTPAHASSIASINDTVIFMPGNYAVNEWEFANSGVDSGWITYKSYDGGVNIYMKKIWWCGVRTGGKNYLQFLNLNFIADRSVANAIPNYGFLLENSQNILLQDITVSGCNFSGIYTDRSSYFVIDRVHLFNCCCAWGGEENMSLTYSHHFEIKNGRIHDPGSTQRIGLDMKSGCHDAKVHHMEIYNLPGIWNDGIYIDARGDSYNIEIFKNKIHDIPEGPAFSIGDEDAVNMHSKIYNIHWHDNISYRCRLGPLMVAQWLDETYKDMLFEHNTSYDDTGPVASAPYNGTVPAAFALAMKPEYTDNFVIRNNIVFGRYPSPLFYDTGGAYAAGKAIIDNNLWYSTGGFSSIQGTNNVTEDPLFVNPPDDLRLKVGSPAIGAASDGLDIGAIFTDGFPVGSLKTATLQVTVNPPNLPCQIELWLGPDETTKVATSGKVDFISTGVAQSIALPVTMPVAGTYSVYVDIYAGEAILSFAGTEKVIVI